MQVFVALSSGKFVSLRTFGIHPFTFDDLSFSNTFPTVVVKDIFHVVGTLRAGCQKEGFTLTECTRRSQY
jgi:hypothetical protein